MVRSIQVQPKKRGRPATGKDPLVGARFPQELIDAIDAWASQNDASRSEAIRRLVELGLRTKGRKRVAVSREPETPLEAARRYVMEQEAKIGQQRQVIGQLAAHGRPTVKAKRDLTVMEHALILLRGRVARLSGTASDDASG